jgi:hypothetical protein
MAAAGAAPTLDVLAGAVALDEDIPRVLKLEGVSSLGELGWSRPNRLSLLVPMKGIRAGVTDEYLLRLGFQAYRKWPPSAQFVNPDTQAYAHPQDQHHVPVLTSPECQTHIAYPKGAGTIQLVCCSATLEFYEVLHSVEQHHLWRETNTFLTTIVAIRKAFASHYQGRFPAHGR